jgi:hypothetical protein
VEEEDNPDPNAMWRRGVGDEHERIIALIDARLADLP